MKTMKLVKVVFEGVEYEGVEPMHPEHPEVAGCVFCDFNNKCLSTRGMVRKMCVQMMGSSGYLKKKDA